MNKFLPSPTFAALSDPTRAAIVELLSAGPRAATDIHRAFPIAAPAVSRHLRVLREAGLIDEVRPDDDRRLRVYSLNAEPLGAAGAWIAEISRAWQTQLDSFRDYVALRSERATP